MARRYMAVGAALALAGSLGFVGTAFGSGPNGKTTCTNISGNINTTITISGCTDTGSANTGGSSQPIAGTGLATGGSVTWHSGKSTTFGAAQTKLAPGKKCPGYVKGGANNPTQATFKGSVTAPDTAGFKIPGKFKGVVCVANDGTISALKPLKVS